MAEVTVLLAMRGAPEEFLLTYLQSRPGVTVTRRCADSTEVLAAALAGVGQVVVIDKELGVDRSFLTRLAKAEVTPIVVARRSDHDQLHAMGGLVIDSEAPVDDQAVEVMEILTRYTRSRREQGGRERLNLPPDRAHPESSFAMEEDIDSSYPDISPHRYMPKLIGVISPWGSPGRTSLAVHLAAEYAERGIDTLVVDGDVWGSSVKQVLGLPTDTPGIAAAMRAIERGTFDDSALEHLVQHHSRNIAVLGGLSKAERWREVSVNALDDLWESLKRHHGIVIVDGPVRIPEASGMGIDDFGPKHNAVWDSLVEAADVLCLVGSADTVGVERLVSFYLDLVQYCDAPIQVVVNQVRPSAAGPRAAEAVHELLARFAGVDDPILIPDDRVALDKATLHAEPLTLAAPRSAARSAFADLSNRLHPHRAALRSRPRRGPKLRKIYHT